MTTVDLKVAQVRLGWSNIELAKRLCVTPVSLSRWRGGHSPIPPWVGLLVQAYLDGWRPGETFMGKEWE